MKERNKHKKSKEERKKKDRKSMICTISGELPTTIRSFFTFLKGRES